MTASRHIPASDLLATVAPRPHGAFAPILRAAIRRGAEVTGCQASEERRRGTRALLGSAAQVVVEVALVAQALQREVAAAPATARPLGRELPELLRDTTAAASRRLWRALEARPRAAYGLDHDLARVEAAACDVLSRGVGGAPGIAGRAPLEVARAAAAELLAALTLGDAEGELVAERACAALGCLLALFLLAESLLAEAGEA